MDRYHILCFSALFVIFRFVESFPNCTNIRVSDLEGVLTSPNYPDVYPDFTSCSWRIDIPKHSVLSISLLDVNIEADDPHECGGSREDICCRRNWLSLPVVGEPKSSHLVCGNLVMAPFELSNIKTASIKFHSSKNTKGGRGFRLKYLVLPIHVSCRSSEFTCKDGLECVSAVERCDGFADCRDQSDEADCPHLPSKTCESLGLAGCPDSPRVCYNASSGACARQAVCPSEHGDWMTCQDDLACIHSSQVCDGTVDCEDHSDESSCGDEPTTRPPDVFFMCDNFKWVRSEKVCNGNDDCGDHSDEDGCVRPSLETAIILACLSCSLLFILLASYIFHAHQRSNSSVAVAPHLGPMLSAHQAAYLLPFREPPPPYPMDPPSNRRRYRRYRRHGGRSSNSPGVQTAGPAVVPVPLDEGLEVPQQEPQVACASEDPWKAGEDSEQPPSPE